MVRASSRAESCLPSTSASSRRIAAFVTSSGLCGGMLVAITDRDAGRAVDQEVRHRRRQHHRLFFRAVVIRPEMNRVLLDFLQQLVGERRQAALGVAKSRRRVAVQRAEVARAVDHQRAQRERLRHAHQRVVNRGVAVRVIITHHVTDDLGALPVLGVGAQPLLPHRVKNAPLHRLQAVAHIGQRAAGDDRERVVEVAGLRDLVQRRRLFLPRVATAPVVAATPLAALLRGLTTGAFFTAFLGQLFRLRRPHATNSRVSLASFRGARQPLRELAGVEPVARSSTQNFTGRSGDREFCEFFVARAERPRTEPVR